MNVEIDITGKVIKTERLLLRPFIAADANDFYEYARVDGVGQMAGWLPHKSIQETKLVLSHFLSKKNVFAITYKNKVIGSIGIEDYSEEELPEFNDKKGRELGYVLSKDYWGQGLMTEAVSAVIKFLFDEVNVDFIACSHFVFNNKSWRVQEKCGFVHYKQTLYTTRYGETYDAWISILENK